MSSASLASCPPALVGGVHEVGRGARAGWRSGSGRSPGRRCIARRSAVQRGDRRERAADRTRRPPGLAAELAIAGDRRRVVDRAEAGRSSAGRRRPGRRGSRGGLDDRVGRRRRSGPARRLGEQQEAATPAIARLDGRRRAAKGTSRRVRAGRLLDDDAPAAGGRGRRGRRGRRPGGRLPGDGGHVDSGIRDSWPHFGQETSWPSCSSVTRNEAWQRVQVRRIFTGSSGSAGPRAARVGGVACAEAVGAGVGLRRRRASRSCGQSPALRRRVGSAARRLAPSGVSPKLSAARAASSATSARTAPARSRFWIRAISQAIDLAVELLQVVAAEVQRQLVPVADRPGRRRRPPGRRRAGRVRSSTDPAAALGDLARPGRRPRASPGSRGGAPLSSRRPGPIVLRRSPAGPRPGRSPGRRRGGDGAGRGRRPAAPRPGRAARAPGATCSSISSAVRRASSAWSTSRPISSAAASNSRSATQPASAKPPP